jgi:hypothetical protein
VIEIVTTVRADGRPGKTHGRWDDESIDRTVCGRLIRPQDVKTDADKVDAVDCVLCRTSAWALNRERFWRHRNSRGDLLSQEKLGARP